jgi:hypothetical protein
MVRKISHRPVNTLMSYAQTLEPDLSGRLMWNAQRMPAFFYVIILPGLCSQTVVLLPLCKVDASIKARTPHSLFASPGLPERLCSGHGRRTMTHSGDEQKTLRQ